MIKNLEEEVAMNPEALDQASAVRVKELAELNTKEKDALQAISALKSTVIVLCNITTVCLFRCLQAISRELQTPSNTRCEECTASSARSNTEIKTKHNNTRGHSPGYAWNIV